MGSGFAILQVSLIKSTSSGRKMCTLSYFLPNASSMAIQVLTQAADKYIQENWLLIRMHLAGGIRSISMGKVTHRATCLMHRSICRKY